MRFATAASRHPRRVLAVTLVLFLIAAIFGAPDVVFEVLSPGNRSGDLIRKYRFYEQYGIEEYYLYDPDNRDLSGWRRVGSALDEVTDLTSRPSPRLGVRFDLSSGELRILGPDNRPFATYVELVAQREQEERARKDAEHQAAELAQRAERLAAKLRELGVNPDI